MDIKSYIAEELAKGQSMEKIMASIAASANAAEKEYEASKVKVKDYSQPLRNDPEVMRAIADDEVSSLLLADIVFYWLEKQSPGFSTTIGIEDLDALRTSLANELDVAVSSVNRITTVLANKEMSDMDKLWALGAELMDMKLAPAKTKVKNDSERILNSMKKLGF